MPQSAGTSRKHRYRALWSRSRSVPQRPNTSRPHHRLSRTLIAGLLTGTMVACHGDGTGVGSDTSTMPDATVVVDLQSPISVRSQVGFLHALNIFEVLDPSVVDEIIATLQAQPSRSVREIIDEAVDPDRLRVNSRELDLLQQLSPRIWKVAPSELAAVCLSLRYADIDTTVHIELYDDWIDVDNSGRTYARNPMDGNANRAAWRDLVRAVAQQAMDLRCSDAVYTPWGEPDALWETGNNNALYDPDDPLAGPRDLPRADYYALFVETRRILAEVYAEHGLVSPRLAGPNTASYRSDWLGELLDALTVEGVSLDVASWHELGPEREVQAIAQHAADAIEQFDGRGLPMPPRQVTETINAIYSFAPGASLAYLAALERAQVDGAARACWAVGSDNYCYQETYDGLFAPGGLPDQPLPGFWVYSLYAAGVGRRVSAQSDDTRIVALAGAPGLSSDGASILVGYYGAVESTVDSYLDNHPPLTVRLSLHHLDSLALDLPSPQTVVADVAVIDYDPELLGHAVPAPLPDLSYVRQQLPWGSSVELQLPVMKVQQVVHVRITLR